MDGFLIILIGWGPDTFLGTTWSNHQIFRSKLLVFRSGLCWSVKIITLWIGNPVLGMHFLWVQFGRNLFLLSRHLGSIGNYSWWVFSRPFDKHISGSPSNWIIQSFLLGSQDLCWVVWMGSPCFSAMQGTNNLILRKIKKQWWLVYGSQYFLRR